MRLILAVLACLVSGVALAAPPAPAYQTNEQAAEKSAGCVSCHTESDSSSMHLSEGVLLGCGDCHGGNAQVMKPDGSNPGWGPRAAGKTRAYDSAYRAAMDKAHVVPKHKDRWNYPSSAHPERSYAWMNQESPEFIRFINPSDYRVAREACGACHLPIIQKAERSLMANTAMFWGAAAYNNGILPFKHTVLGEAYTRDGEPALMRSPVKPDQAMRRRGVLEELLPLPAWEVTPPGDNFRVFERGGRTISHEFPEIGLPNSSGRLQLLEEPGRPDIRQSNRGPGTGLRISVPLLNIHKSRLNDPNMWFLGTNDQPGDYRSSGCAACHVVYANDRDPRHSGPYAAFGNMGMSQTVDPTIPKDEPGHPLKHVFTRAIPTSQCMVCHMHQPNIFINSMLGYTMWDYEADAPKMWPEQQKYPTDAEILNVIQRNPEEAASRGKWGDVAFLKDVSKLNDQTKDTRFADYHGHGWNFRAVYKRDRKGNLLDEAGGIVANDDPQKFDKAVHLSSIHVDKGMHCVDCHFEQDAHGNGLIYSEVPAAIEIHCVDCHGTADAYPNLRSSGPAAMPGGRPLFGGTVIGGRPRFQWREGKLYQRSALDASLEWEVHLVKDTVNPAHPLYNEKAARAKLMSAGQSMVWGGDVSAGNRAHKDSDIGCITCHTSWTTSCSGCHLPIQANWKTERHHYEGGETRNYATYNPQVSRDDIFQIGRHGTVKNGIIAPVRSSSALVLSSTNLNRARIYIQQPPIAASGYSSQAFAPHYPHTERTVETKTCSDCHLSQANDNNAIMAQLFMLGTNFVNFVGFNAWVGEAGAIEAVRVTEWDEPQAVVGSYLHRYAYPDWYRDHQARGRELPDAESHSAGGPARCIQLRGEYLYVAEGPGGMRVYDVASIANKDISQKIISSPVSPLGQDTRIRSADATCVALPTNQPIAPERNTGTLMRDDNQEQPFHPIYHYAFVTDAVEGLIVTNVDTLADAEPRNNFLERALTWNENGVLTGARHLTIAGTVFYVSTPRGVAVVDMADPLKPRLAAQIPLPGARATAVQFRYLFVTDDQGLQVVDVTEPTRPVIVAGARVALADAHNLHVARTFAYVAAGRQGLAIIDVERPAQPKLYQMFTADGRITDARDVVVATTNASLFAYVADGAGGLKVVQLTSPESQPNFYGFSPDPKPELIAWRSTRAPALSLSRGLERDRGVDETGNQVAVFGRIGSRPFTLAEMKKLYLDPTGKPWYVDDQPRRQDYRGPAPLPAAVTAPAPLAAPRDPAPRATPLARPRLDRPEETRRPSFPNPAPPSVRRTQAPPAQPAPAPTPAPTPNPMFGLPGR